MEKKDEEDKMRDKKFGYFTLHNGRVSYKLGEICLEDEDIENIRKLIKEYDKFWKKKYEKVGEKWKKD